MKRLRTLLSLFIACILASPPSFSQNTSTQGKEFWLSFMHNGFKSHNAGGWVINQVLISAKRDCSGTVSNPLTGWSQSFSISANSITTIEIPEEQGYHDGSQHERIFEKGIKVTANDTVSVYCTNIAHVSFDASFVLPIESLGDEYIIQCCDQSRGGSTPYTWNNETSAFLIVATEDNTDIDITPSVNTLGGHLANRTFTVTMHAGETYHVRSERLTSNPIDLSGTYIHARNCKRIAVFNGNTITRVPLDAGNGYDHVFEQAMPLRSWGRNFIVTSSKNRLRDFIKITSSADDNIVTMNGETLDTLRAGQSYYFSMPESEGSCYLQSTQPSAVYLYHSSHEYYSTHDDNQGDPSMLWIAPVEQRIKDVTFTTFDHPNINIETHFINIIVHTKDSANVYLDGNQIPPSNFLRVNGNDDYIYARLDICHGVHRITCHNGFNAHVYGFGFAKGYAYMVGSNAIDLSTAILVEGEIVQQGDTVNICSEGSISFGAEVLYQNFNLEWDFGDGSPPSHNTTAIHTYDSDALYEITLTVTSDDIPCEASTSTIRTIYLDLYHTSDSTLYASTCYSGPSTYNENGFNIPYDETGTYEGSKTLLSSHGCDSTVHLILEVGDLYHAEPDTIRLCYDDTHLPSYTWRDGENYTTDTLVIKTLPYGDCQGLFTLDLSFINNETLVVDWPEPSHHECDSFYWAINGQTYYSSGVYSHFNDLSPFGCERETQLHLTLSHTPHPYIDSYNPYPHWLITTTEFTVHPYTFFVNDSTSDMTKWKTSQCRWDISKDSWSIVPNPHGNNPFECVVCPMDWSGDTVWLSFTAVNDCDSITVRYDLHPSYYGLSEDGSESFSIGIAPNPTTGKITITGENLKRAEVFNMLGQQMLDTEGNGNKLHINMTALPSGIYFITITNEEGRKCVRKVVKE